MFEQLSVNEIRDKLNRRIIAGIAIAVAVLLLIGSVAALESQIVDRNRSFNVSATVEPPQENNTTVGVNTGQAMHYGNITHETNFTKFMEVGVQRKSILQISASGNISEILYFEEKQYFKGSKNLSITAGSETPGRYTGKLYLEFQVPETK